MSFKNGTKRNVSKRKKTVDPLPKKEEMIRDNDAPRVIKGKKTPTLLRGMKDILPRDWPLWGKILNGAMSIADAYGYGYIEPPVLEEASLFVRSIGKGTDVVEKEMYIFDDRDGTKVALRPEFTAGVVRAFVSQGMHTWPQPVKLWYLGQLFRHDRPQAGRFRQFHQFGCEVFGERRPVMDAELIAVAYNFLRDLGVNAHVAMNSIGTREDRERYIVELLGYLRSKRSYLPEEIKKRMQKNPLRVLDSKLPDMQGIIEEAPQIIDWLNQESREYFMKVLEYLDALDIPYVLQPTLVRGLDYYSDTVFELYEDEVEEEKNQEAKQDAASHAPLIDKGSQTALGGGGRYDTLVEQLGGPLTPAAGFSIGLERVVTAMRRMRAQKMEAIEEPLPTIFFAQLGEQASKRALFLIEVLRRDGMYVHHNLGKTALKAQMEIAHKVLARYTIILGQKEVQDGTIIIRDMDSGIQEIIDQKKLVQKVKKIFEAEKDKKKQ